MQRCTYIPELSNFIPSLSFAHCRRSRWNMIEPLLIRICLSTCFRVIAEKGRRTSR